MAHFRRAPRCAFLPVLSLFTSAPLPAAQLVTFDFDDPGGGFTAAPATLHPALVSATFSATQDELGDFAGNPGRALASAGFTAGNRIVLELAAQPGYTLQASRVTLDLRASASGPGNWLIELEGGAAHGGALGSGFDQVTVDFAALPALSTLRLAIGGSGASSASGTLRIDNLRLEGNVLAAPVPLPTALPLLASAMLGMAGISGRRATRASHRPAESRARA